MLCNILQRTRWFTWKQVYSSAWLDLFCLLIRWSIFNKVVRLAFAWLSRVLKGAAYSFSCLSALWSLGLYNKETRNIVQFLYKHISPSLHTLDGQFKFIHSSMVLQPFVGPWPLLQFRNLLYTGGRTPWTSDQPVARPLPIHRTIQTQKKRTHIHPCCECVPI
jgi:hypothetical protein